MLKEQGANYVVSLVNFVVSGVQSGVQADVDGNYIKLTKLGISYTLGEWTTEWNAGIILKGLKILPYQNDFATAMTNCGTEDGQGGRTATGTATVTITDLDNSTSAVKEITVNFTYTGV